MAARSRASDRIAGLYPGGEQPVDREHATRLEWHVSRDTRRILFVRALRGFADGLVSVLLAGYLTRLGFTPLEVGAIVAGTLVGSAGLTIALGLAGHHLSRRRVLLGAAALMCATGIGFTGLTSFWPLLVVAVLGTLNPSAGDVSVFLPTEQAALAQTTSGSERPRLFAWYNVAGNFTGAAAASVTNVPRSLAAALPPLFTGVMLMHSTVGWPLVCGGVLKVLYDLLLLAQFRSVPPRGD